MTDRRTRILVVDDSLEYLEFMETLLRSEDFDVAIAATLDAARDRLAVGRPDLIIADVRLPNLPAFALLDLVDTDPRLRDVPLLFCTGAEQEVIAARERLVRPATDVILKPFDIDELLSRVAQLIKR